MWSPDTCGSSLSTLWCPYGRAMWCGSLECMKHVIFERGHRHVENWNKAGSWATRLRSFLFGPTNYKLVTPPSHRNKLAQLFLCVASFVLFFIFIFINSEFRSFFFIIINSEFGSRFFFIVFSTCNVKIYIYI